MIFFIFSGEEWLADVEFVQDAAEGPHVNRCSVRDPENDLWRSIEPTLDVCVNLVVLETSRTEVDNFDARFIDLAEENILWLEVTVHDIMLSHVV